MFCCKLTLTGREEKKSHSNNGFVQMQHRRRAPPWNAPSKSQVPFSYSWTADCFWRHAWCRLSVFSRDAKFLLEAVRILSLCEYCWSIGLQSDFLDMHGVRCLFSLELILLINWIADWLLWHTWCALSLFFHDKNFLEAVGMLSLCKYSWSCRLFSKACIMYTVCFLSWCNTLALSIWNFKFVRMFWSIGWFFKCAWYALFFFFLIKNSCSRHLKFRACTTIVDQLDCRMIS